MANTGKIDVAAGSAYNQSFGNMQSGTVYQSADLKADMRPRLNEAYNDGIKASLKAHQSTSGGAGTAGYAMIPVFVDSKIIDQTRKYTPLVEIIPRVTNNGITADYNTITAKGGAVAKAEDAALAETNTTYARQSTAIKFLYAIGRVTGISQAAQPSYILAGMQPGAGATGPFGDQSASSSLQQEVLVKAREMKELEESLIVNGDAGSDANEFSGIVTLMGATNTVDKNTSALELGDLDLAIRYAFDDGGRPNLGVCSSGVFADLLGLLNNKVGFLQANQQAFWGFSTIMYHSMVGSIPIIPSMYLSNVSGSKAIYFLDLQVVEMRVLQDMTFEKLAKTNDSEKFMLKVYEALIIRNTAFCSSVTEISA